MKKLNIRFIGTGYNNYYQANVKIFDMNNKLVYKGCTFNGRIDVCLKENCCYKLNAALNNQIINAVLIVGKECNYEYIFYNCCLNEKSNTEEITFLLTDYYYNNLPIERGNLLIYG